MMLADASKRLEIAQECRRILRDPHYSAETCAQVIEWLKLPNAAISDLAGQCLLRFGWPAFDDLLAVVIASQPWPNAVWVLSELSLDSDRLLPYLRSWLSTASGNLELQCAISLAHIFLSRSRAGHAPDPSDSDLCLRIMTRHAADNAAARVHLRDLRKDLGTAS
jgi:hypothetical protein